MSMKIAEMVHRYDAGVDSVRAMQRAWDTVEGKVDDERFRAVRDFLFIQEREARRWHDATLACFQTYSRMPFPSGARRPTFLKVGHPR